MHVKLFEQFVNEGRKPKEYSSFSSSFGALNWLKNNQHIAHEGWIISGNQKSDEITFYAEDNPKATKGNVSPFDEDELEDLIDELTESVNEAKKWDKQPIETKYWTISLTQPGFGQTTPKIIFTQDYIDAVDKYKESNKGNGYWFGKPNATFKKAVWELISKLQEGKNRKGNRKGIIFSPKRGKTNDLIELLTKWGNKDYIKPVVKRK
tara:strand:+ start:417 stop:1040 length:624 start_codon:yes stop_codon:yes gene_type:complete